MDLIQRLLTALMGRLSERMSLELALTIVRALRDVATGTDTALDDRIMAALEKALLALQGRADGAAPPSV